MGADKHRGRLVHGFEIHFRVAVKIRTGGQERVFAAVQEVSVAAFAGVEAGMEIRRGRLKPGNGYRDGQDGI